MNTDTPETDALFYLHGYPCGPDEDKARTLCERLERERDHLARELADARKMGQIGNIAEAQRIAAYWHGVLDCECASPLPTGGCLKCDMARILGNFNA